MSFDSDQSCVGYDERRRRFYAIYLEPMVTEAKEVGIPMTEVLERIIQQLSNDDQ